MKKQIFNSFDDMLSLQIGKNNIKEEVYNKFNNESSDKNIYKTDTYEEEEEDNPEITEQELTFLKESINKYNELMENIEKKQNQMKEIKEELNVLKITKTQTHKVLLPFMIKKQIDKLEGGSYNLEVKNTSKLQIVNKPFILNCLKDFLNDDETYNSFIEYMNEQRTRTKSVNLTSSKQKISSNK